MFTRKDLIKEPLIPCYILIKTVRNTRVFSDQENCFRYIFQMYAANLGKPGSNLYRKDINKAGIDLLNGKNLGPELVKVEHEPLVNIISFALTENQAHFILTANKNKALIDFITKLNLGFVKYYNIKNNRRGRLFNRPFKIVSIQGTSKLNKAVYYVNTEITDNHSFSSFLDLFGTRKSKITADKSSIKYLGINFNKYDELFKKN